MPGVVFLIVVPTANFERELVYGTNYEVPPPVPPHQIATTATPALARGTAGVGDGVSNNNNLNINLPENNNAVLRLEVELRDKNAPRYRRGGRGGVAGRGAGGVGKRPQAAAATTVAAQPDNRMVPLEKVLEELLAKLEIEHVTWTTGKKGYFHQVIFPLQSGEPCETTLHCLTELGIGTKLNSSVSVVPCSVTYDALTANQDFSEDAGDSEELSKWNTFVESIKSKLTVKQVVDGVRAGGSLSFDYLLLIVTADSLAALGLIENNAPNITAAMLVSPLMGPVMSITFGTIISDRELMRVGFISLAVGMFISCLFGFVFGLILGTCEMPWGAGDWPTEEMRGRGNARSLWMGVLWALTSGTGVAVALLQGSAGPLIGVAISASLLPPVVNCGLFWALACIWLIYPGIRIPHLKGESFNTTSAYPFIYTDYLPTEFLINGIVSCLLTVVNVICIFTTAIIVLKIKEVSAPYTASPDLKRFWETDLRTVRKSNRSTMRQRKGTFREKLLPSSYQGLEEPRSRELDTVLEQALKEAEDDVTFKKVKRMSYSSNAAGELTQRLAKMAGLKRDNQDHGPPSALGSRAGSRMNSLRHSKVNADLKALDKLVSNLLEQHTAAQMGSGGIDVGAVNRKSSIKLSRWRPTSRSAHSFNVIESGGASNNFTSLQDHSGSGTGAGGGHTLQMPTIMESNTSSGINTNSARGSGIDARSSGGGSAPNTQQRQKGGGNNNNNNNNNINSSSLERNAKNGGNAGGAGAGVRNVLQSIANAPQRFSQSISGNRNADDEENLNLTQNYIA